MVLFVLFCAAEDVWEEEYETEWLALASANIMGFIFCLKEIYEIGLFCWKMEDFFLVAHTHSLLIFCKEFFM